MKTRNPSENYQNFRRIVRVAGLIFLIVCCIVSFVSGYKVFDVSIRDEILHNILFKTGINLFGLIIAIVLYYSCLKVSYKDENNNSVTSFLLMIFYNGMLFVTGSIFTSAEGHSNLSGLILGSAICYNIFEVGLCYCFWSYVCKRLDIYSKAAMVADKILKVLLIPAILVILVNLFVPFMAYIDGNGMFVTTQYFFICDLYLLVVMVTSAAFVWFSSRAPLRHKIAATTFIVVPTAYYFVTAAITGYASPDAAILIALLIMFNIIFIEQFDALSKKKTELTTATKIQAAMILSNFPYFTEYPQFDLYASMTPAREVGGDFYDFFLTDEDHLCLLIADVSDKGVPAALFMASSKSIISACANESSSPAEILKKANDEIVRDNTQMMFVTVWLGILEISTGKLRCANAGHECPIYKSSEGFRLYKDKHFLALGIKADNVYHEYEIDMQKGDMVFLYTDGVEDAKNYENERYTAERLIEDLNKETILNSKQTIDVVKKSIDAFTMGNEQFDDTTMLCLQYNGCKRSDP